MGPFTGNDFCIYSTNSNNGHTDVGWKCTNTSANTRNCNLDNNNNCVGNIPSSGAQNGLICSERG
jgi:hypothetical protein